MQAAAVKGSTRYDIAIARSPVELEEIYRFRYSIYVEEMARRQNHADHDSRTIVDPLDQHAFNFFALRNDSLCGVVRVNFVRLGAVDYYTELYRIVDVHEANSENSSICTRLMIKPEYRRRYSLAVDLCVACYEFGIERGIRFNFIDCNDYLVPFFVGLGYREYMGTVEHEEYGQVHPLLLDLHDEGHLRRSGSPFLGSLVSWRKHQQPPGYESGRQTDRTVSEESGLESLPHG